MSHRARRSGRNIRQSSRNRASRSVKYSKLPISAGTIDSDDEVMPEEQHPNVEVEEQDKLLRLRDLINLRHLHRLKLNLKSLVTE